MYNNSTNDAFREKSKDELCCPCSSDYLWLNTGKSQVLEGTKIDACTHKKCKFHFD